MGAVLQIVGYSWAGLGVILLYFMFSDGVDPSTGALAVIVVMLAFVLPELAVGGKGTSLTRQR